MWIHMFVCGVCVFYYVSSPPVPTIFFTLIQLRYTIRPEPIKYIDCSIKSCHWLWKRIRENREPSMIIYYYSFAVINIFLHFFICFSFFYFLLFQCAIIRIMNRFCCFSSSLVNKEFLSSSYNWISINGIRRRKINKVAFISLHFVLFNLAFCNISKLIVRYVRDRV